MNECRLSEVRWASRIENAIAAGSYDVGVETLTADSLRIIERRTIHTHAASGAETRLFKVMRRDRNLPLPASDALVLVRDKRARLLVNAQSGCAAVQMPAPSLTLDDGEVQRRVRLVAPRSPMFLLSGSGPCPRASESGDRARTGPGTQRRAPAIFRRAPHPIAQARWGPGQRERFASRGKIAAARRPPLRSGRPRGAWRCSPGPAPAKGSP
jgi:hypothetical protein